MRNYKIVFMGEPGAGKTTCISQLSRIPPVNTDVVCTDELSSHKETTTVAIDYGEMDLEGDIRLLLYGLPGQARFSYMFDVVREGLLGIVLLVDGGAKDPLAGLTDTLNTYGQECRQRPCVVALNKAQSNSAALGPQVAKLLRSHGVVAPILPVDARGRDDVQRLFEFLFLLVEFSDHQPSSRESIAWL